jgi:8-oxo-dGTP pyrophosphatase MutT (NUDIX family)
VTALAITEDGNVVLVKQYRHGIQQTILEVPGGCVDDTDKDYEAAARRELLEETGYEFNSMEYLGQISPNPSTNDNWMHMFLARGGRKVQELSLDHNEDIEVVIVSLDELKDLVRKNEIKQALHVTTILYALLKMGEQL